MKESDLHKSETLDKDRTLNLTRLRILKIQGIIEGASLEVAPKYLPLKYFKVLPPRC